MSTCQTSTASACGTPCTPRTPHTTRRPLTELARVNALLALWRQRRALGALNAAALRDIGITSAQAQAEAERPIWDVPANWRS